MQLKIENIDNKKYQVSFGKNKLEISETSNKWNNEGINEFLIDLATKTPDDEQINIECNQDLVKTDKVYEHIVELFEEFASRFNELNANEEE